MELSMKHSDSGVSVSRNRKESELAWVIKDVTNEGGILLCITPEVQDARTWLKTNMGYCAPHSLKWSANLINSIHFVKWSDA